MTFDTWSGARSTLVVVEPPTDPLFTLAEGKLLAGVDWPAGDPREPLMTDWITAARSQVERDVALPLLTQTLDLYVVGACAPTIELLRPPGRLQSVAYVQAWDGVQPLDPTSYRVDLARGTITLLAGLWPVSLTVRFVGGWDAPPTAKAAAPLLIHAAGLLVAHYATLGRDLAVLDASAAVNLIPQGYADAIVSYQPVEIA